MGEARWLVARVQVAIRGLESLRSSSLFYASSSTGCRERQAASQATPLPAPTRDQPIASLAAERNPAQQLP